MLEPVEYLVGCNPFAEVVMRMVLQIKFWAIKFAFAISTYEN